MVAGAGAIGCFVGGLLANAGAHVTLMVRPRIAAEIRAHGLTLTDQDGMAVNLTADDLTLSESPACLADADLVLVTVKSRDTSQIGQDIQAHAPLRARVVSLQNGVSNAEELRHELPGHDVRAGMVPFNVVPMGQGCYHRAVDGGMVIEAGQGDLADILNVEGLECRQTRDIEAVQWGKFLLNLNNALNALSGMPLQQQLKDRGWRKLMADQWAEALSILRSQGIRPLSSTPVSVSVIPWILRLPTPLFTRVAAAMLRIDPQARTSMSYDLMEHRPTEIEALQGEIVRRGEELGRPTPINAMVLDVVRTAEIAREGLPYLSPRALRAEINR
ncbi:2-dehydropantoate 2-reductase [Sulfitobacter noctilucicola]|nr:2-dehydropantoate 2-reductase [Sulfitobacter noctilucicola]